MKYVKLIIIILLSGVLLSSCDKGFEQMNKSPDLVQNLNVDFTLPYIELTLLDGTYYTNVSYLGQFMYQVSSFGQDFASLNTVGGGNYHFDFMYNNTIKNEVDFLDKTKDPALVNYHSIGRILKAYTFQTVTDLYGDVPYFNAGKGYLNQDYSPAYDAQQQIYQDMLNELQDAASHFDPSQKMPSKGDVIFSGDVNKWKKFAYSLMLRLALRMERAAPESAKKWINTAIHGGIMQSNSDNCIVFYKPNTYYATISNGQSTPFVYYPTWKLAEPFVAFLRDNNDPRLPAYAALPNKDTMSNNQIGLPPFTPTSSIPLSLDKYSVSQPLTFAKYDAPFMHLSFAEVEFMLAECVVRSWIGGDAKAFYESGVRAAMQELAAYGPMGVITDAQINNYLNSHPYAPATTDDALNMINTQYWVETHYNWYETFANWRRSGYPKLDESKFTLPRRLTYPSTEVNINSQHVQEAVKRQGPDVVSTRVWWDK